MGDVHHAPHRQARPAGTGAPAGPISLAGRIVGGCRLIRPLSMGGMGEVYLGQQLRLGERPVAVKLVRPEAVASAPSDTQAIEQRFLQEGAVLGVLAHPNILPVHDSGLDNGYLYLVMQYAPDGSLADAIKGRGPLRLRLPAGISLVTDLIGQIATALQYTHDHGIVHRDVKPGNILLQVYPDGRWHAMLADFGIAHGVESTANTQQVTGTVAYMAPEQLAGHFSPASDQYALGVLAFLMLTGRTPFLGGITEQVNGHLYQTPPPIRSLNSAVPLELAEVVCRALNKNPADRWSSVAAFSQAFRRAADFASLDTMSAVPPPAGLPPLAPPGETTSGASDNVPTLLAQPALTAPALPPKTDERALHRAAPQPAADVAPASMPEGGSAPPNASAITQPHATARATPFVAAPPPAASPHRRSESRRRLAIFAATVALLLLTSVAAVALKERGTSRGAQRPRYTATAGEGPTYTPAGPTLSPGAASASIPTATAAGPAASPDQAVVGSIIAPSTVYAGQVETVKISFTNTGTTVWSTANGYTLVCDTVGHQDAACGGFPVIGLGSTAVQPGQSLTFTLNIKAPAAPGTYQMYWNLANNGQIFGTPDAAVALNVVPAPAPTATPRPTNTPAPVPTNTPPASTATPTSTSPPAPSPTSPAATATIAPTAAATKPSSTASPTAGARP